MSKSRFNAILRNGQAERLPVDAMIPPEGATRCGTQDIEDIDRPDEQTGGLRVAVVIPDEEPGFNGLHHPVVT
jgi:hypothetical protein